MEITRLKGHCPIKGPNSEAKNMPKALAPETDAVLGLRSRRRMLCLYGTDAQRQKLSRAAKAMCVPKQKRQSQNPNALEDRQEDSQAGLAMVFQVLGTLWSQQAWGCSGLPFALSKTFLTIFQKAIVGGEPAAPLCFKCSITDRLQKALRYLRKTQLEVEKKSEALAEQYALAKERIKDAQSSAQLAAKLGLCTGTLDGSPSSLVASSISASFVGQASSPSSGSFSFKSA